MVALSGDCSWELRVHPWVTPADGSWWILLCPGERRCREKKRVKEYG